MTRQEMLTDWADRAIAERVAFGIVIRWLIGRGVDQVRAQDLAQDAVQEAHCKAQQALRDSSMVQTYEHYGNWIRRAAVHAAITEWRRTRRERPFAEGYQEQLLAKESNASQLQASRLWRFFRDILSPEDRSLLEMQYKECLTLDEIAGQLQSSTSTVWRRLQRILQKLRQQILEAEDGPGESPS